MNSLNELILLTIVGRIIIWLWMQFPLPAWVDNSRIGKLHTCSVCSGTWIYFIIFTIFRVDLLNMVGFPETGLIGWFRGGGIISYLVYLLESGFRERFMTVIIE